MSCPSRPSRRSALLLAHDGFAGAQDGQPVAQQRLGLGVDDGDGVGRRALGAHRRRDVLRFTEDFRASCTHEGRRLDGKLLGDRTQQNGIGVVFGHAPIAAQSPAYGVAPVANRLPDRHA